MKAIALIAGAVVLGVAAVAFAGQKDDGTIRGTVKAGDTTDIKARDGSTHRLMFASGEVNGKKFSGWVATSTDTGLRFKDGEIVMILGSPYRFKGSTETFGGAAFIPA